MSTVEKDRKVIHRAVRVLDEIESRIHELREELEQSGMVPSRGRKAQPMDDMDDHEATTQGKTGGRTRAKADHDDQGGELHGAAKAAHDAKGNGDHRSTADDDHEPHAQGRVKHPESDKRLKANREGHEDGDQGGELHGAAKAAHETKAGHDDENGHEPHGQGKAKHPETDKRLKANKD